MASTMEVLVAGFRLAARLETETAPAHASPLAFLYAPPRPAAPPADSRCQRAVRDLSAPAGTVTA
jgi:hypothetical protein